MKISTLINKLSSIQKEHGDLLLFDDEMYAVVGAYVESKEDTEPPIEYKMPKLWATLSTTR